MLATSPFLEGEIEDEIRAERVGDSPESRESWLVLTFDRSAARWNA